MKISVVEKKDNISKFLIEDTNFSEMNLLRRTIMFEVPVIAIEDVYFTKNSSPLYDEIIAQRLGLIPLSTDLKTYNLPEVCKCKGKGCSACQVKLSVSISGPATVYAKDMKTTDSQIKPIYPNMIITKLGNGQELAFEAVAVLGKGSTHMKWSPALAYYINKPSVKIDQNKVKSKVKQIIDACPSNVFELKSGKLTINKDILLKNNLATEQARYVSEKFEGITFEEDETKFILTIESWGQLTSLEILKNATQIMKEQLSAVKI